MVAEQPEYQVLITNPSASTVVCDPVGRGISGWRRIKLTLRYNEVSHGVFVAAAFPWLLAAVNTPGNRAAVVRYGPDGDTSVELAGPIEQPTFGYTAVADGDEGVGTVEVNFADDLARIGNRVVYPSPGLAVTAQAVAKYTITGVNAELAMRALVDVNAGPSALTARRVPGLGFGPVHGVGTTVTAEFRFMPLLDALRSVAVSGGGLGFRTVQVGRSIEFEVFQPQDLSASVRFSRALLNITDMSYAPAAPTCTVAIVGGQDSGASRVIRERINAGAHTDGWERVEKFVDARGAANATELDRNGDEALADGGPSAQLRVAAVETVNQRYGYDFHLGDKVAVEPYDGLQVIDVIRSVEIEVTPERGEVVTPGIGTQDTTLTGPTVALQRDLLRRLQQIETST